MNWIWWFSGWHPVDLPLGFRTTANLRALCGDHCETVRLAFAIDTHDREIIAWVATSGGR